MHSVSLVLELSVNRTGGGMSLREFVCGLDDELGIWGMKAGRLVCAAQNCRRYVCFEVIVTVSVVYGIVLVASINIEVVFGDLVLLLTLGRWFMC